MTNLDLGGSRLGIAPNDSEQLQIRKAISAQDEILPIFFYDIVNGFVGANGCEGPSTTATLSTFSGINDLYVLGGPEFTTIEFQNCTSSNNMRILSLGSARELQTLNINYCGSITYSFLLSPFKTRAPKLLTISINEMACDYITIDLSNLYAPNLSSISIVGSNTLASLTIPTLAGFDNLSSLTINYPINAFSLPNSESMPTSLPAMTYVAIINLADPLVIFPSDFILALIQAIDAGGMTSGYLEMSPIDYSFSLTPEFAAAYASLDSKGWTINYTTN